MMKEEERMDGRTEGRTDGQMEGGEAAAAN